MSFPAHDVGEWSLAIECVLLLQNALLSTESLPFLQNVFSSYRMCSLTILGDSGALEGHPSFQKIRRSSYRKTSMLTSNRYDTIRYDTIYNIEQKAREHIL